MQMTLTIDEVFKAEFEAATTTPDEKPFDDIIREFTTGSLKGAI